MISILSRNFEPHIPSVWKKTSMLMKPKIGWGSSCACTGCMKRALNSDFWLINLSDGLMLLIFVLDLGLYNMFFDILFLNYVFPIRLGICGLWICSSKNIVFLYKVSFQNIEKSVGRTFSFQPCLNFRW